MTLLDVLAWVWLTLGLFTAVRTTLDIGKPRPPITPGVAALVWLFVMVFALVVTGVIR